MTDDSSATLIPRPTYLIRRGSQTDIPSVFALIQELALFEKAPDEVENTVEQMLLDGFGEHPLYGFFVAEDASGGIIGMALYYFRYSTWKGKRMYLEDLIVTEAHRGQGVGKELLDAIITEAKVTGCNGVVWQVLEWNEPAIQFYKKYGATLDGEWINCVLKV